MKETETKTTKMFQKTAKERIPERKSIHLRPKVITEKKRFGDWETDSVIFRSQTSALSVQYERKIKLFRLKKVQNKTAFEHKKSIREHFEKLPKSFAKKHYQRQWAENVFHGEMKRYLSIPSYFCDTYSSWQKGGVENLNRLIREYFPKRCAFDRVTQEEVRLVQEKLNDRPRKSLRYLTPNEVFARVGERGH